MSRYRVEVTGESREVYIVEADSYGEASEKWSEGRLLVSEASSMEVQTVTLDTDA
jgi:hypothetical protein